MALSMGGCVLRLAVALGLETCHPFMTKAIFYIKAGLQYEQERSNHTPFSHTV